MITSLFSTVPDHRVVGRCIYPLSDLLTIALLTFICGGDEYVDMSEFAHTRARDFGLLSECGENSPSPDTFERLMSAVKPEEIERCLRMYGKQFLESLAEKQIAIDGKKLRGVSPKKRGTEGDYLLNAFVTENHFMIAQEPLQDKENEIVAIPKLLDKIDIAGATVSIDAIGTQVHIAQKILEKDAHYFLAVKDNQKGLHESMIDAFRFSRPMDEATEMEADHGRIETRRCRILKAESIADKEVLKRWPALRTLVEISTEVIEGDTTTRTTRHYISDDSFEKAAYYNMLARGHWGIENQLHWHLDVTFHEDASRARKDNAPQNLSMVRKMALQIVKNHQDKRSVRKRMFRAALDQNYFFDLINNAQF